MRNRSGQNLEHDRGARRAGDRVSTPAIGSWFEFIGPLGVMAVAAVLTAVVVAGCGTETSHVGSTSSGVTNSAPVQPATGTVAAAVSAPATVPPAAGVAGTGRPVRSSVPPDISVAVSDTTVFPGEVVEFTVEGTADVTEMALADGRGDSLPLVRDESTGAWTVPYRVPLKPRSERIALSVTARNDDARWRRVWVFLHVADEVTASSEQDGCVIDTE